MGISPANSQIFFNFSSLFSQGNNASFASVQGAAASYANGALQVRSTNITIADVLDLSQEGLAASQQTEESTQAAQSVVNENETVDTTLKASELSEADRVEMIRVNKNAVLSRVNELLAEKGLEVPEDQPFELTTNLMDGSVSVKGIEDPELLAAFNEALQDDEQLVELMRKTRNELGLPEQENTVPRNFTIQFNSMQETPEGIEIDFHIDLFITQPKPVLENESDTEETTEAPENDALADNQATTTYQMSITLSNRIKMESSLIEQLGNSNVSTKTNKEEDVEEIDEEDESDDADDANAIVVESENYSENEIPDLSALKEMFAAFGSNFQATSSFNGETNGLNLHWHLQLSNWSAVQQTGDAATLQQLFQTMNIGGSMQIPSDESAESISIGQ